MRIHSSMFQPNTLFAKSGQTQARAATDQPSTAGNRIRDKADISPRGKLMSSIQQLTDQKKSLMESKRNLITRTMEENGDMEAIAGQLDAYTKQMEEIDKQVSQLSADYAKQVADQATKKDEKKQEQSGAEEESTVDSGVRQLTTLANAVDKVQHAESVSAVQSEVEGSARVQDAEVHLGKLEVKRNEDKEASGTQPNLKRVIARMKSEVRAQEGEAYDKDLLAKDMDLTVSDQLQAVINQTEESSSAKDENDASGDTSAESAEPSAAPETPATPSAPAVPADVSITDA